MSNLEHLIENGLFRLDEGKTYKEWREAMQEDCNWKGNENITLDNLWEICQYVIFTWDSDKEEVVRCKDCRFKECEGRNGFIVCDITGESHQPEWFCADGKKR